MAKIFDIAALGEILIDFTETGTSENGMKLFEQNPGGAPANLLVTASHMGYKTAIIGKTGADMHGAFLKETLKKEGVCTDYIIEDNTVFTTLAFVALNEKGERYFSFARKPGADTCLSVEELDKDVLKNCQIFHFGSLSLTDEPARSATIEAVKTAKEAGAVISFDPNYRKPLWKKESDAAETIKGVMPYADLVKVSDEESVLLTGEKDYKKAALKLLQAGPHIIAITLGSEGVYLAGNGYSGQIPGFKAEVTDTTGAGDSFWGGFLSKYLGSQADIKNMTWEKWKECAEYGNATASLCVQKRGGIPAIPLRKDVEDILKHK